MPAAVTLFEERTYTKRQLLDLIGEALGQPAEAPECEGAFEALCGCTVPRASFVWPGIASVDGEDFNGEEDDDGDDTESTSRVPDPSGKDADDGIHLLHGRSRGWKVAGVVGSGALGEAGLTFEILPKIVDDSDEHGWEEARCGLLRMWEIAEGRLGEHEATAAVEVGQARLLHEWLIERFLGQLEALLARGIRLQYMEREDNLTVHRGRLLPQQNLYFNRFAPHRFYCRFDELSLDRPENRLIRAALERVARSTSDSENKRRARSLAERLYEVPPSRRFGADFAAWRDDRLMVHYREIRNTCRWILSEETPSPVRGEQRIFGCFARMSKLFENYVAEWLRAQLRASSDLAGYRILQQHQRRFCWPRAESAYGQGAFMKPDILVQKVASNGHPTIGVLDTKWKRHTAKHEGTRHIARADLYQMVSYGRFWLPTNDSDDSRTAGALAIIYPSVSRQECAKHFRFAAPMNNVTLSTHWFRLPRRIGRAWEEGLSSDELRAIVVAE